MGVGLIVAAGRTLYLQLPVTVSLAVAPDVGGMVGYVELGPQSHQNCSGPYSRSQSYIQSGAGIDDVAAVRGLVTNTVWDGYLVGGTQVVETDAFLAVVEAGRLAGDEDPLAVTETLKPPVTVVYIQPGSPADSIFIISCWNFPHAML